MRRVQGSAKSPGEEETAARESRAEAAGKIQVMRRHCVCRLQRENVVRGRSKPFGILDEIWQFNVLSIHLREKKQDQDLDQ